MKATEFDAKFDADEDLTPFLDFANAQRPGHEPQQLQIDCPAWMIQALDREAKRLGVSRQAMIKVWLADRLNRCGAE
jgi:hypothetical protein